jgi:hypothetical protein
MTRIDILHQKIVPSCESPRELQELQAMLKSENETIVCCKESETIDRNSYLRSNQQDIQGKAIDIVDNCDDKTPDHFLIAAGLNLKTTIEIRKFFGNTIIFDVALCQCIKNFCIQLRVTTFRRRKIKWRRNGFLSIHY